VVDLPLSTLEETKPELDLQAAVIQRSVMNSIDYLNSKAKAAEGVVSGLKLQLDSEAGPLQEDREEDPAYLDDGLDSESFGILESVDTIEERFADEEELLQQRLAQQQAAIEERPQYIPVPGISSLDEETIKFYAEGCVEQIYTNTLNGLFQNWDELSQSKSSQRKLESHVLDYLLQNVFYQQVAMIDQESKKNLYIDREGRLTLEKTGKSFQKMWLMIPSENCAQIARMVMRHLKELARRRQLHK